jgi:hypothetical protein
MQEFYRAILIWQFDFITEKTEWSNLYAGPYRDYGRMVGDDYWNIVNGLTINAVIMEYLGTIGAVDLTYVSDDVSFVDTEIDYVEGALSLHDGLLYFRINNWGQFLLGQADAYAPPEPGKKDLFTIDDDLRIHLLMDLLPNEVLHLETMAEAVNEKTYRLDTVKMLTALESGQKLGHLADFLRANHRGELPQPVTDLLTRLKQNQGAFKEGKTAVLIQLNHADLLDLVQQDQILSGLCRPVDDHTVLVLSGIVNRFRKRLKELGYLLG